MKSTKLGDRVLSALDIEKGVHLIAAQLNRQFEGDEVIVITMVPGGILFCADLVRQFSFDIKMDYVSCPHTPGERNNQSEIIYHQNVSITDQHVLLIDDAIESGGTMKRVVNYFTRLHAPHSISIATLFVKPGRVHIPVTQYYAYEMATDENLVGYGLPWQDKHRNLPFVAKLGNTT
ncbi:hypoxanthine phosphoribosyltransferase [Neiella marina]|uniref:Hypoxanthine phosphoribosyltransferase n=1 Tax=Neiella holothuriorum TaxID=2870530 RepID=A0ABS7EDD5_9GAMM|nr:phosphoribosyltransferase family protein [Neiella holothuriorum]MBW8190359.1 hypoxanthine phosphoribosyltransferase [Neiella holothuriorum]